MALGDGVCPICRKQLELVSKPVEQGVFWQKIPEVFQASLAITSLIPILLCSVLSLGLLGPLLAQVIVAWCIFLLLLVYGCADARHVVSGHNAFQSFKGNVGHIWSHVESARHVIALVLVALSSVALCLAYADSTFAVLASFAWLLVLPLMLLTALRDEHEIRVFNINAWVQLLGQLGGHYFVLLVYGASLLGASLVVWDLFTRNVPSVFAIPISVALVSYATLVYFRILGLVLRQQNMMTQHAKRHVGTVKVEHAKQIEADISIALKTGQYEHLFVLLERELRSSSCPDFRREQLYKLVLARDDVRRLELHSQTFLRLLLARGRNRQALDLLKTLRVNNVRYRLYDAVLALSLAGASYKCGEHKLLLWLANDAHERFDGESAVAELYMLAARALITPFREYAKAAAYLRYVSTSFAQEEVGGQAETLLRVIERRVPA